MSNPRPCECGHPKKAHIPSPCEQPDGACCSRCYPQHCGVFRSVKRTEPLRARRATWSLERMQEVIRSTGYTPRVENTYHLRAEPVRQPGHVPEPSVPVRALREFLDAERKRTAGAVRSRDYWNGRFDALAEVRSRFCD